MNEKVAEKLVAVLNKVAFDETLADVMEPELMAEVVDVVEQVELDKSEVDNHGNLGDSLGEAFEKVMQEKEQEKVEPEPVEDIGDEASALKSTIASLEHDIKRKDKLLRKFSLLVLDDQHGINHDAYTALIDLLVEDHDDIMTATEIMDNRIFLNEDFAEEELGKL